jgi:hypothetical protein
MSSKWKILLSIVILGVASLSSAKKETTYSVKSKIMKTMSDWVDEETIVFIDLDDNVMMPKSLMFSYKAPYRSFIDDMVTLGKKVPHYNFTVAKWYQQRAVKLVEDGWPEYIQKLRSEGAKVYGVCKMPLHLVNIEQKRYKEVQDLNIQFDELVNEQQAFQIEKIEDWFSFFYKGIIFTGPYSISHTLLEFLKVTNNIPKKILFISSAKPELDRVDQDLRGFDMKFYNVLYLGARDVLGQPDRELVQFQQQELIKNGRWMEDDVANVALQQYKKTQPVNSQ